jgi:chromosome segregation ATPase
LVEYQRRYGQPTTASFNPSTAKWRDDSLSIERYYAGRENGTAWPSLNSVKDHFNGSFNEALEAAGLPRNRPGPSSRKRAAYQHAPVRDVREHRVYVSDSRVQEAVSRQHRAELRESRARATAALAVERAREAEAEVRALRRDLEGRTPRIARPVIETKTKIIRDDSAARKAERAAERADKRAADAVAARRATEDQLKAANQEATRERGAASRAVARAEAATEMAASADQERRAAERERDRLADRVAGLEASLRAAQEDVEHASAQSADAVKAAAVNDLVRRAETRAQEAEIRAARAEREMAEQGAAVTGERRRLTAAEINELRRRGPAGPVVLGAALKRLAKARAGRDDLGEALSEVASASLSWKDRL